MNKLPSTLTKNQAIAYAVIAFSNFIDSGNTSDFDISTIKYFVTGAMGVHNKSEVIKYSEKLIENKKDKMMMKIDKINNK